MATGMVSGRRFACQNPECGCEIEVTKAPRSDTASNPWCACGAEMKRRYVKPSVTTLPLAKIKTSHA
jgi:hypothetical protein